jgi:acyl-coenzyme A synthetase/AMP-(fatty) acid ligase
VPPFMVSDLLAGLDRHPASLTRLMVGAEPVAEHLLRSLRDRCPHLSVINAYGPTEAAVVSTLYLVPAGAADSPLGPAPIGRPIANTRVYVLDTSMAWAPLGVAGELYIGGDGLAIGYLHRPALTAERFVPDPFGLPGARLYRTGDRARWRSDGHLEFLGRTDLQIKLRGLRIEVEEIEAALRAQDEIDQAAVVVAEAAGDKALVAFVVAVPGMSLDSYAIRRRLVRTLPGSMVPARVVALDRLPVTAHGKVDRAALRARAVDDRPVPQAYSPPCSDLERQIADIWEEVIDVRPIGLHDDFFEMGGHSLLAMRVVSRIRARFEIDVPVRVFLEAPTTRQFAEVVEQMIVSEIEQLTDVEAADLIRE